MCLNLAYRKEWEEGKVGGKGVEDVGKRRKVMERKNEGRKRGREKGRKKGSQDMERMGSRSEVGRLP